MYAAAIARIDKVDRVERVRTWPSEAWGDPGEKNTQPGGPRFHPGIWLPSLHSRRVELHRQGGSQRRVASRLPTFKIG
jgi:hypothetical protein